MILSDLAPYVRQLDWIDGLLCQLAKEKIGKRERVGVYIDDTPYYVNEEGQISLKPFSQFAKVTTEQLTSIVSDYDTNKVLTSQVINNNVHAILSHYNIPIYYKNWFMELVVAHQHARYTPSARRTVINEPHEDGVVLSELCDVFDKTIATIREHSLQHLELSVGDGIILTFTVRDDGPVVYITRSEHDSFYIKYEPGYGFTLSQRETTNPLDNLASLYAPHYLDRMSARSKHDITASRMYSTISALVGVFENLGEVEKAIIEALSKEVTILDESKVRPHIFVKGSNIYTEKSTLGDICNGVNGTPLTISNVHLCKDSIVTIDGILDESSLSVIQSIAYSVRIVS